MDALHIDKNLELEAALTEDITYLPLAGKSEMSHFRSPDSYVFIFFERCEGFHSVDFIEYKHRDWQVHISFPGQIHSWKTKAGAKGHKLIVPKKFIEIYPCGQRFSTMQNWFPVIDVSLEFGKVLVSEFNMMQWDMETASGSLDTVSLRVQLILSMISNMVDQYAQDYLSKSTRKNPILPRFAELIEANFNKSKSVRFYADNLAVTPNYLNIVSKTQLKLTAKEVIDNRIVLEAKRLLLGSDLSIKEITYHLGFRSGATFAAFMLRKTGFYPKTFRDA